MGVPQNRQAFQGDGSTGTTFPVHCIIACLVAFLYVWTFFPDLKKMHDIWQGPVLCMHAIST